MFGFFLGLVERWKLILVAITVLSVLCVPVGYYVGKSRGASKARLEEVAKARAAVAEMEKRYREQELAHEKRVLEVRLEYARVDSAERASDAARARALGSGAERVRIKVASCRPVTAQAGGSPSGVDGPGQAELAPETSAALFSIAADGDAAIRQLTALQEWSRSAVKLCNGVKK